jgi:ABC-type glycerol-3-phosphate transport system permease component
MTTTESWGDALLGVLIDVIALAVAAYSVLYAHFSGWRLLFAILLALWALSGLIRRGRTIWHLSKSRLAGGQ